MQSIPDYSAEREYRILRRDGQIRWVHERFQNICDSSKRPLFVQGAIYNITERKRAEAQIRASLREKEVLLREIHHRVKNNLAIVSSLLSLQSDSIESETARTAFQVSRQRIQAMSRVHEHLYRSSDLAQVDMAEYVRGLVAYLRQSYGEYSIAIQIDVSEVTLDIEQAIPAGLIINELVSNVLKHAFPPSWEMPEDEPKRVIVALQHADGRCELRVSDNGAGLPAGFELAEQESLGLKLIYILTRQLEGDIRVQGGWGHDFYSHFRHTQDRILR